MTGMKVDSSGPRTADPGHEGRLQPAEHPSRHDEGDLAATSPSGRVARRRPTWPRSSGSARSPTKEPPRTSAWPSSSPKKLPEGELRTRKSWPAEARAHHRRASPAPVLLPSSGATGPVAVAGQSVGHKGRDAMTETSASYLAEYMRQLAGDKQKQWDKISQEERSLQQNGLDRRLLGTLNMFKSFGSATWLLASFLLRSARRRQERHRRDRGGHQAIRPDNDRS